MKWIIGIGEGRRSPGVLGFGRWLADATGARWGEDLIPVHVLGEEHLRLVLRHQHLDEAVEAERASVARQLSALLGDRAPSPELVQALDVEEGLEAARARHRADGVVVSRVAAHDSRRPFPLGAAARGLLNRLASPVVVVPPDLDAAALGDGPVVALSSLAPDSIAACLAARALAETARRELTLVHVVPDAGAEPLEVAGRDPRERLSERMAKAERSLVGWIEEHRVWPDRTVVLEGEVASAAIAFAEARKAGLLVIGGYPSDTLYDTLAPRLWRRLAAIAPVPVLVTPATPGRAARLVGRGERAEPRRDEGSLMSS